jgi:hypothetical protein
MTLKAFKAAVQPGVRITVLEHWIPANVGAVRTVTKVQGNGYWYTLPGRDKRFWGDFTKASEMTFDGTTCRVRVGDERNSQPGRHWTLRVEGVMQ